VSRNKQLLRMRRRRSRRRAGNKAFTRKFRAFMHQALHGVLDAAILERNGPAPCRCGRIKDSIWHTHMNPAHDQMGTHDYVADTRNAGLYLEDVPS